MKTIVRIISRHIPFFYFLIALISANTQLAVSEVLLVSFSGSTGGTTLSTVAVGTPMAGSFKIDTATATPYQYCNYTHEVACQNYTISDFSFSIGNDVLTITQPLILYAKSEKSVGSPANQTIYYQWSYQISASIYPYPGKIGGEDLVELSMDITPEAPTLATLGVPPLLPLVNASGAGLGYLYTGLGRNRYGANYTIMSTFNNLSISSIPVPAAAWLMGSGLIGLAGIARRKK